MTLFGKEIDFVKNLAAPILFGIAISFGIQLFMVKAELNALKKEAEKKEPLTQEVLQTKPVMIDVMTEAEWCRKQLITKHGLYMRTKKSLEEQLNFVKKLNAYLAIDKSIYFEIQRCVCSGACPRWRPNGKYSDCGNQTCPVCSKPDPVPPKTESK